MFKIQLTCPFFLAPWKTIYPRSRNERCLQKLILKYPWHQNRNFSSKDFLKTRSFQRVVQPWLLVMISTGIYEFTLKDIVQCQLYSAEKKVVPAHGKALVDTQLSIAVPPGTYGRVAPRSGLGVSCKIG